MKQMRKVWRMLLWFEKKNEEPPKKEIDYESLNLEQLVKEFQIVVKEWYYSCSKE